MNTHSWLQNLKKFDAERYFPLEKIEGNVVEKVSALYALNLELANIPWKTADRNIAILKLRWWEESIETIELEHRYKAHPFLKVLAEMVKEGKLEKRIWKSL